MSTMIVTTKITYKYLMHKSKHDLSHMVLDLLTQQEIEASKLQAAYAWIIAQESCPDCFGFLTKNENRESRDGKTVVSFYHECCDCGKRWTTSGREYYP